MEAIEDDFAPLKGQLPKDYDKFEGGLLEDLLRSLTVKHCGRPAATCLVASMNTS